MASRKKLSKEKLIKLGAEAMADLLMEEAGRSNGLKQRLTLVLATEDGPAVLANEVRKRIGTIGRSSSFIDWKGVARFQQDLE